MLELDQTNKDFLLSRKTHMWRLAVECLFDSTTSGIEYHFHLSRLRGFTWIAIGYGRLNRRQSVLAGSLIGLNYCSPKWRNL